MNEDFLKHSLDLFSNPLFRQGFAEFFFRAQQDGIDAARAFWDTNRKKDVFAENAAGLYEQVIDFYSALGFVSKQKYEEVVGEKEKLAKENEFLKSALRELNSKIYAEGSMQAQEIWKETIQKQMEMSSELAKSFLSLFKQEGGK